MVPFPGGVADTLSRMNASKVGEALGQPVVVENKPGGSGAVGAQEVIRAPADGHTIFPCAPARPMALPAGFTPKR